MHKRKLIAGAGTSRWRSGGCLFSLPLCVWQFTGKPLLLRPLTTPFFARMAYPLPGHCSSPGLFHGKQHRNCRRHKNCNPRHWRITLSSIWSPNSGANPASTVYTVVYQLSDGTVKTEYWIVPTTSPTNLATVRTILGTGGNATSLASRNYVEQQYRT